MAFNREIQKDSLGYVAPITAETIRSRLSQGIRELQLREAIE